MRGYVGGTAVWVVALLLTACGQHRPPRLVWPANLEAIENMSADAEDRVNTNIAALNTQLDQSILGLDNRGGSPISIKGVSSFEPVSETASYVAGFGIGSLDGIGLQLREATGTRIAGRATVEETKCTIELGDFLLPSSAKDLMKAVLWHEIGHCAGLMHVTATGELMSPITVPFSNYSAEKIQAFLTAIRTSIGNLNLP